MTAASDGSTDGSDRTRSSARVHVILSAGHCNRTGGGAPGEAARTPRFARAYADALRRSGCTVHYLQQLDDAVDRRPDFFSGTLGELARRAASIAGAVDAAHPVLLLDLHLEAGSGPRGCFAIVPDDPTTSATGARSSAADDWANNERARSLGSLLVQAISRATGIPVRRATEPGLMSERQTQVGAGGSRLAMFSHTAPLRDRMIRLIIEHGNIVKDQAILDAAETPARCAGAVAEVVTSVLGNTAPLLAARDHQEPFGP